MPIQHGRGRVPGIKIHDTRLLRLLEVLLPAGTQITGWRSRQMHEAVLTAYGLSEPSYTLTQLRYDLRKLKAHGLVERLSRSYNYRLTSKGIRVAVMLLLFHKRVCGPLAHSLFAPQTGREPETAHQTRSRLPQSRRFGATLRRSAGGVNSENKILRLAGLASSLDSDFRGGHEPGRGFERHL